MRRPISRSTDKVSSKNSRACEPNEEEIGREKG
jgi:hypothetical protein